jgi:hypothetical protein
MAAMLVLATSLPALAGEEDQQGEEKINAAWEFARANRLASAGAVTRSIPHYEKVLMAAPEQYPQAHFNLAEVYRFKKNCRKAVLLYNAYLTFEQGEENRADAMKGISQCSAAEKTGTLSVEIEPSVDSEIRIEGYVLGKGGVDKAVLLAGKYAIEARATDHVSKQQEVEIEEGESEEVSFSLDKKLFHGTVRVDVSQEGATIKLEPKKLDSPKAKSEVITLTSPMDKPQKLATGKYFLEVTKSGYDRWIRNIYIKRDEQTGVDVNMSKALPEAIRSDN